MKKLSVFFMLLLHMNFYMFMPQCPEQDSFDANGQQTDDINSVIEYAMVELGYDKTADDEDDDNGNDFLLVKNCDFIYNLHQSQVITQPQVTVIKKKMKFPVFQDNLVSDTIMEVATPPPDFFI